MSCTARDPMPAVKVRPCCQDPACPKCQGWSVAFGDDAEPTNPSPGDRPMPDPEDPAQHWSSCSWCNEPCLVTPGVPTHCIVCGHRSDLPRMECTCAKCRPAPGTTTEAPAVTPTDVQAVADLLAQREPAPLLGVPANPAPQSPHSPEPWTFDPVWPERILDANAAVVIRNPTSPVKTDRQNRDNGRRIVAAINACRGVPTEDLERLEPDAISDLVAAWLGAGAK